VVVVVWSVLRVCNVVVIVVVVVVGSVLRVGDVVVIGVVVVGSVLDISVFLEDLFGGGEALEVRGEIDFGI